MENKLKIQVISYSPQWHSRLLDYMRKVFPYRDDNYLDWWLFNMDSGNEDDWSKCFIVTEDDKIIGCTTAIPIELFNEGKRINSYFRGNTIISPEKRGKGISKLLYDKVNSYNNWLSVGITDIAWAIQPKYVKNFTPINPVNVYVSANGWLVPQLFRRFFGNKQQGMAFLEQIKLTKNDTFIKIKSAKDLCVPKSGRWTHDKVELVRDEAFLQKRYFDVYCAERYAIYRYEKSGMPVGFVVLRKMRYSGFDMVSVVDFRFADRKDERKAFAVAQQIARMNKIGFVLAMSSRNFGLFGTLWIVKTPKKLNFAVGNKGLDFNDMLVTSGDSDLDFVYYQ